MKKQNMIAGMTEETRNKLLSILSTADPVIKISFFDACAKSAAMTTEGKNSEDMILAEGVLTFVVAIDNELKKLRTS